jgi:hypothetical protein
MRTQVATNSDFKVFLNPTPEVNNKIADITVTSADSDNVLARAEYLKPSRDYYAAKYGDIEKLLERAVYLKPLMSNYSLKFRDLNMNSKKLLLIVESIIKEVHSLDNNLVVMDGPAQVGAYQVDQESKQGKLWIRIKWDEELVTTTFNI